MANISSPFGQNEWLVEEMYRKFRDDPSSVDPSWHEFLVDYSPEPTSQPAAEPTRVTSPLVAERAAAAAPQAPPKPADTAAAGNGVVA
ncbi:2-oxoglutarate dehydrogenase E1 subunit family protein, partial [Mycobacterium tuberculosis]